MFKKRIKLCVIFGSFLSACLRSVSLRNSVEPVVHSDNAFASVAYLRILDAELEQKHMNQNLDRSITPPLISTAFDNLFEEFTDADTPSSGLSFHPVASRSFSPSTRQCGQWISIANLDSPRLSDDISFEEEVRTCYEELRSKLSGEADRGL